MTTDHVIATGGALLLLALLTLRVRALRRRDHRTASITDYLQRHPDSPAYKIAPAVGIHYGALYFELLRLEEAGHITSHWSDGPPRQLRYRTTSNSS